MDGGRRLDAFQFPGQFKRPYNIMSDAEPGPGLTDPHQSDHSYASGHQSSSSSTSHDRDYQNDHAARRTRLTLPPVPLPFPRHERDGYDFRRPIFSEVSQPSFVDLTAYDPRNDHARTRTLGSQREQLRGVGYEGPFHHVPDHDEDIESRGRFRATEFMGREERHPMDPPPRERPRYSIFRRPEAHLQPQTHDGEDDLLFISEQPRVNPRRNGPRNRTSLPRSDADLIDLTAENDDDDDEVVVTETRTRYPRINEGRPTALPGLGTRSREDRVERDDPHYIQRLIGQQERVIRLAERLTEHNGAFGRIQGQNLLFQQEQNSHDRNPRAGSGQHTRRTRNGNSNVRGVLPLDRIFGLANRGMPRLDFEVVGFNMGLQPENRQPSPKYMPPPDPEEGFTRGPAEDEVVVCPNCGDELCTGDDDLKQQLWVIKSCGHAYCGACAANRSRTSKGKGKATMEWSPLPFKKCVVPGCGKPAAKSSMVHVYF